MIRTPLIDADSRDNPRSRNLWSARLDELMWACGWSQDSAAEKFSVSHGVIARVLHGGQPKVKFILRLKQLEAAYAGEIEALRAGSIVKTGPNHTHRVDFRRPSNLSTLGATGTVGEDLRFGVGEREAVAPRVVYLSAESRRRLEKDKKAIARRSKVNGGGTQ